MFRTITRLLFGGAEETPKDVKSGEVEEGWLVVNHPGEASNENIKAASPEKQEIAHQNADVERKREAGAASAVLSSRATSGSLSRPRTLAEPTQFTCIQKTQSDGWCGSRNAIQRQNGARRAVQHTFHLQQPGPRGFSR